MALPEQRGHTCVPLLRNTSESRFTLPDATPVCTLAEKPVIFGLPKRFWTHTGTPAASSGRGDPKVAAFTTVVCASSSVHCGLVVLSQPVRQTRSGEFSTTGKLCDEPVVPLSRSVPELAVTRRNSRGPPAGLSLHWPPPLFGTHETLNVSWSVFGLPSTVVFIVSVTSFEGLIEPFFLT